MIRRDQNEMPPVGRNIQALQSGRQTEKRMPRSTTLLPSARHFGLTPPPVETWRFPSPPGIGVRYTSLRPDSSD